MERRNSSTVVACAITVAISNGSIRFTSRVSSIAKTTAVSGAPMVPPRTAVLATSARAPGLGRRDGGSGGEDWDDGGGDQWLSRIGKRGRLGGKQRAGT